MVIIIKNYFFSFGLLMVIRKLAENDKPNPINLYENKNLKLKII